jgi:SAM-dependent methyltransferase
LKPPSGAALLSGVHEPRPEKGLWHAQNMGLEETLAGQLTYYRRRAPEYDETSLGDTEASSRRFAEITDRVDPTGDLLEIACGTGLWTKHLIRRAKSVTALDASPEMIELARERIDDRAATFVLADIFAWEPERRYDSIFFGFWLSHVPTQGFPAFWELLNRCLAPAGRVLFVDEGAPRASKEDPDRGLGPEHQSERRGGSSEGAPSEPITAGAAGPIVERRLRDGTVHRIVKVFHEPGELSRRLTELGWSADIELTDDGLIVGVVRRR